MGTSPEKDKIKWVSWKSTMTPIDLGGMGFGSLQMANLAMLSKWWWRFKIDRGRLWRKVVWALHSHSRSWSFIPAKLSLPGPWKQIRNISRDFESLGIDLAALFQVCPSRQKDVSFWKERWLFEEPLCDKFPQLFCLESNKNALISDRVVEPNGLAVLCTAWSRMPHSVEKYAELNSLTAAVQVYGFGAGGKRWRWALDANGDFTVSSIRNKAERLLFSDLGLEFEWNNWTPIKVNFLVWFKIKFLLSWPLLEEISRSQIIDVDCVKRMSRRCIFSGVEKMAKGSLFGHRISIMAHMETPE
ncbi:hypothetical protein HanLR1_Chr15g0574651 [Helianthus annuus]|nr:hypothetical protein HanHA89_Chr15g0613271 [Helianthus annuus]KAJ0648596.1 hypothetical protein HanLR1_Chr15g0574651 [Helianthus annuus]